MLPGSPFAPSRADASPLEERVVRVEEVHPYQPGWFFRHELPCLLAVLRALPPAEVIVVDGCICLGGVDRPGPGAHLYQALGGRAAVVGVAKTRFQGAGTACEVRPGQEHAPPFYHCCRHEPGVRSRACSLDARSIPNPRTAQTPG